MPGRWLVVHSAVRRSALGQNDSQSPSLECALAGVGGVVGEDENKNGELRACEFSRIKGGKPFDIEVPWFTSLLASLGQPKGVKVAVKH